MKERRVCQSEILSVLGPCPYPPISDVFSPKLPPLVVVVVGVSLSGEDGPSPLVDEVAEREEGDLLQGHLQQEVQLSPCGCQ